MKKLVLAACAIGFLVTSGTTMAAGNKIGLGVDQGFGVAGQFNNINAFVGNDGFSADYLFKQGNFGKDIPFNWYVGGGAYYNWSGTDNIGLRVPLGITIPFAKKWDVYGQISPALDFDLDRDDVDFELDAAIGVRYAF